MRNIHVLAVIFSILLVSSRAYSEEVPVKIRAENLKYDQESGLISASGSVEIMFEGMKIRSDTARIDTASNVATAEGHVKIEQTDYNFLSSRLTYDMSSETAYVFNVTPGGVESCNCHMRDQEDRDTHITLTPDAKHTTAKYRIIAEVTPRFRAMMKAKGIDWSTSNLKKMLIHKKIKISGWLFADTEHTNATEADRPGALHNWRASILEVHPVTMIEVVK